MDRRAVATGRVPIRRTFRVDVRGLDRDHHIAEKPSGARVATESGRAETSNVIEIEIDDEASGAMRITRDARVGTEFARVRPLLSSSHSCTCKCINYAENLCNEPFDCNIKH